MKKVWESITSGFTLASLIGLMLITIFVNLLYDLIVAPGVSWFGRAFLNVLTLGSQVANDIVYKAAAFDPRPVTSLLILLFIVSITMVLVTDLILRKYISRLSDLVKNRNNNKYIKIAKLFRLMYVIITVVIVIFSFYMHNQSVLVWRIFDNNIKIVSPYITNEERMKLISEFSGINSKIQFEKLQEKLNNIAELNNVSLREIDLW